METLIVHPENKKQLSALKTFMKAFKVSFEEQKSDYCPAFVSKIQEGRRQIKNGETRIVNIEDL